MIDKVSSSSKGIFKEAPKNRISRDELLDKHREERKDIERGLSKPKDYADYKNKRLVIDIVDHRKSDDKKLEMPETFVNEKKLRDYQQEAVHVFLKKEIGVLEIGTGGGKTLIAAEIIRRLGCKTLFIVDKIELLRQAKKVIEESLGIEVGVIGNQMIDIKDVTVATIQTLIKRSKDLAEYLSSVKFVIFDECHHCPANSYAQISRYLSNVIYRLGITGTATRDDGNEMAIFSVAGNIIHKISSEELIADGWLMKPKIIFIKGFMSEDAIKAADRLAHSEGFINETDKYAAMYDSFIKNNEERNDVIRSIVDKNKGKKILILTKLIDHGMSLNISIPNSVHLYGETPKKEREKMFEDFTKGDVNVMVSTISCMSEGVDIPKLDIIFNAASNKGDVKTIQAIGRVLRLNKNKENAYYFDFLDEGKFLKQASWARKKALQKQGHDIKIINVDEI